MHCYTVYLVDKVVYAAWYRDSGSVTYEICCGQLSSKVLVELYEDHLLAVL